MPAGGGDAGTATEAAIIGIHPKLGSSDAALGSDSGETVTQSGPYEPVPDTGGTTTETAGIALSAASTPGAADSASGIEGASVATFVTVNISSADSSRVPPTTPSDTDGGGARGSASESYSLTVTLSSSDAGSARDGK